MSVNLSTENIQTTISQLNRDFAGRMGSPDYNESKLLHIHRRNRAFVWSPEMQRALLDSIFKGYYIPPIICSSRIVNGVERREVMEGGNRITTIRRILNGELRELTAAERQTVEAHPITLVVMRHITPKDQRLQFRRLNKNVKVTDGQLFAMSIDDSPLIKEADALLNSDDYPLRAKITDTFGDTQHKDNPGHSNLANAVALISGAIHGVNYITKSYNVQEEKVELQEPMNRQLVVERLAAIFEIFTLADQITPLNDGRKKRGQWSVGKWLGAMLYDYKTHPMSAREVQDKWARYIARVRAGTDPQAEQATIISGAQNLTATRHLRVCTKVDIYLRENRIATDDELRAVVHPDDTEGDAESDGGEVEADE